MKKIFLSTLLALLTITSYAQSVLIDFNFQSLTLPAGVTHNGTASPTKALDGVCTKGMVQLNGGVSPVQFMQVDVSSCTVFSFNAKSTAATARLTTIKYKKQSDAAYTTLTTTLSISTAATFNLTTLFPVIVSTEPISVRIEAGGNIQVHDLFVTDNASVSTAAEITAFSLPTQIGSATINSAAGTIAVNVPLGTSLTSVIPSTLTISALATISPIAATARDFSSPVTYIVTAQSGATKTWTVTVTTVASTEKEITVFQLAPSQIGSAVINSTAGTIAVSMPLGSTLTSLVPTTLTISNLASVAPTPSVSQDFSSPVVYTVTAQDGSTKTWTVTVSLVDPNATYTDYQAEEAEFTGSVATNHLNYTGTGFIDFLVAGPNVITFTVCELTAGSQTVKFRYSLAKPELRQAKLFVNDVFIQNIDFPQTATFDDWLESTAIATFPMGISKIKLTWDVTDGPNLDRMSISGAQCASYLLTVTTTNGGTVTKSPARISNKYFDGEQVTLTAVNAGAIVFSNWSGDLTGTATPSVFTMNSAKNITANFTVISTFTLSTTVVGIGEVTLSPAGGTYTVGTVVTLTANPLLGNSFINWSGNASGSSLTTTVTMTSNKTAIANFSSNYTFDFNKVVGYASMAGDGFAGPTNGGQCATQPVLVINGPAEFNKLCESLYYRQRAFAGATPNGGMLKAPLVILIKAGTYDASQALTTIGGNAFANSMLDIASQGDLTFLGEGGVTFNFGINVKRSYNIIIRNISFHSYGDDGVNVGYPETHHIWVDHCTFGHPTTYPASADVPDGTAEVKDGASYITISWCKFQNHHKTCLLGHSDNPAQGVIDIGRLKVTYFANYFYATNSRHPRTRFGTVHVLNNMYEDVGRGREGGFGYGIGASNSSQVWAEGNFFLDTRWPMSADRSTTDFAAVYGPLLSQNSNIACFGLKSLNNEYDDSGLTLSIVGQVSPAMLNPSGLSVKFDELTSPSFTYVPSNDYSYTSDLLPAAAVRVLIPQNAGADKMVWATSCSVLSLDLVDFTANRMANQSTVLVSWKTLNEQNAHHFEVERSTNTQTFVNIKTVKARNQKSLSPYSTTDESIDNVQYYRLKMFDLDGTFTYSKTVSVSHIKGVMRTLKITPSVSSDFVNIETLTNEPATLSIVDIFGRLIFTKSIEASESPITTNNSVASLPNGIYSVILENKNGRTVGKFVKQ
jgi:pectate lyase